MEGEAGGRGSVALTGGSGGSGNPIAPRTELLRPIVGAGSCYLRQLAEAGEIHMAIQTGDMDRTL